MSEYPPIQPTSGKKGGLAGCLVASLVGCGLLVVLAISAVIFIGWRLTREGPPAAALAVRDGSETLYLHANLRADDAGIAAVVDKLLIAMRQAEATHGPAVRSPMLDRRRAEQWREWFPVELDVARASREGGAPDATVVAASFPAKAAMVRAMFRLVAYFLPKEAGAPLRRADIDGTPAILGTPVEGAQLRFAVALLGDRLVAARELADLEAALRHQAVNVEGDEPSGLVGTVRLETEDGWGYTRPRELESADAIRLAVFSFDVQGDDMVRWRAALRGQQPVTDKAAAEKALVADLAGTSLPEGLRLTLDETRRWVDDRTLMIEGKVEGLAAFLGAMLDSEPETPSAPPSDPDDGSKPQT